jgi:replication fork clamp-binding protein CrfC
MSTTTTKTTAPAGDREVAAAVDIVRLGVKACAAYGRGDLGERLAVAERKLGTPGIHLVVIGEFKKGKSSLVNALVGAPACPVDDDVATALPTYVRHGEQTAAQLVLDTDPPRRQPVPLDQVRRYVVEGAPPQAPAGQPDAGPPAKVAGVEILLPRTMLAGGLVLVDTPGLGGLGSAHAAASLAATSMADAVLFVTDASQELTQTEVEVIRRARELSGRVACVVTKTDFHPMWRRITEINQGHLAALGGEIPLLAVSSTLRSRAVRTNDSALNAESGFRELVKFVSDEVAGGGRTRVAQEAVAEVAAVCRQLENQFEAEREALADPAVAQRVVDDLGAAKERAESLRAAAARWNTTLGDGTADLTADIDHDLRTRIRRIVAEADDAIEAADPVDTWPEMERWLESRVSYELVANYTLLRDRAADLSRLVADHFREAAGEVLGEFEVYNPAPLLTEAQIGPNVTLEKMSARKQTMVALRNSYSGILMMTLLPNLLGLGALTPLAIPIGLMMGRSGLREEKRRQLGLRQTQAKNAIRRYGDEVQFLIGKDSRDTLRRIQRQLRDHYTARAEELNRSTADALRNSQAAAKQSQTERAKRLADIDAELDRLRKLRARARAALPAGSA